MLAEIQNQGLFHLTISDDAGLTYTRETDVRGNLRAAVREARRYIGSSVLISRVDQPMPMLVWHGHSPYHDLRRLWDVPRRRKRQVRYVREVK